MIKVYPFENGNAGLSLLGTVTGFEPARRFGSTVTNVYQFRHTVRVRGTLPLPVLFPHSVIDRPKFSAVRVPPSYSRSIVPSWLAVRYPSQRTGRRREEPCYIGACAAQSHTGRPSCARWDSNPRTSESPDALLSHLPPSVRRFSRLPLTKLGHSRYPVSRARVPRFLAGPNHGAVVEVLPAPERFIFHLNLRASDGVRTRDNPADNRGLWPLSYRCLGRAFLPT